MTKRFVTTAFQRKVMADTARFNKELLALEALTSVPCEEIRVRVLNRSRLSVGSVFGVLAYFRHYAKQTGELPPRESGKEGSDE
jgi:hypothetical protein